MYIQGHYSLNKQEVFLNESATWISCYLNISPLAPPPPISVTMWKTRFFQLSVHENPWSVCSGWENGRISFGCYTTKAGKLNFPIMDQNMSGITE